MLRIGAWSRDRISIEETIPQDFKEIEASFFEEGQAPLDTLVKQPKTSKLKPDLIITR